MAGPPRTAAARPTAPHSPHLHFDAGEAVIAEHIRSKERELGRGGRFIDMGGGAGLHRHIAGRLRYTVLDLDPRRGGIVGDVCACPQIPDSSFDVAFSHNTFEHIPRPWLAAREMSRILRPGGLACVYTWFAVRYHPVPGDYWRYSHSALKVLFEEEAGLETLACGYDLTGRRDDRNAKLPGDLDLAPVDERGGWLENWAVYYVGRKPG